jgi:protein-S-isoprenylcysteine O-methyltransferase Ste14
MVFDRENVIGLVLLSLCAVVALVLLFSIATGTRFRFEGPSWLGTILVILFMAGTIYAVVTRPGRRWSWPWSKEKNSDQQDRL